MELIKKEGLRTTYKSGNATIIIHEPDITPEEGRRLWDIANDVICGILQRQLEESA